MTPTDNTLTTIYYLVKNVSVVVVVVVGVCVGWFE